MLSRQKMIWVEGMMIEPQHFQQQERYFENFVTSKVEAVNNLSWGFSEIQLDEALLEQNKIAIKKARGVFPDGTPFSIGDIDPLPVPLELKNKSDYQGETICLAIAMDLEGNIHTDLTEQIKNSRYSSTQIEVIDNNHISNVDYSQRSAYIQVGKLNTQILLKKSTSSMESILPICHIQEFSKNGKIIFDTKFLPPMLDYRATGWLENVLNEILGIIIQRLNTIRMDVGSNIGSLSELVEMFLLQLFNEYKLKLYHMLKLPQVHPERLFFFLLEMLGKLSFIPGTDKLQFDYIEYEHLSPHVGFSKLIVALRQSLSLVIESPVVALQFLDRGDGIYIHQNDHQLRLEKIIFAVSANMPSEKLKNNFPAQTKVGPVEKIMNLIELQLPGAKLVPLVTPPRHIPYYPNSVYFEIDTKDKMYLEATSGVSMALSIVGDFPDLSFDVWGLRQGRIK